MSEPPRPPGDYGSPSDPNSVPPSYSVPGEGPGTGYPPQPPVSGGGYAPPPSSGGGAYAPPPASDPGYQQPGYQQPGYQQPGYQQPGYQQPGYQQPGYQQPGAYGTPGGPVGYANSDEKTWALIAHFGGIIVGFIAPLVALLAKGNESPTVKAHANEALNFQITWGIAMIVAVIISICSLGFLFFVPFIVWIVIIVFAILGGMKANNGELYHYPATFRFIK